MPKNFENSIVGKTRIRQFRDEEPAPTFEVTGKASADFPDVVFIEELDSFDELGDAFDAFGMSKDTFKYNTSKPIITTKPEKSFQDLEALGRAYGAGDRHFKDYYRKELNGGVGPFKTTFKKP